MPLTQIEAILDKFLSDKSGWFDKCSFELFTLAPKYRPLLGDAGGPKGVWWATYGWLMQFISCPLFMCNTYRILIVLQLFLLLASDSGVIKQESDFNSDWSSNLHDNYMTRVEWRKHWEEPATAPVLDFGSIPELLNCVVVHNEPIPKVPSLSDEHQSIKSARLMSGTAIKMIFFRPTKKMVGRIIPSQLQPII